jgi:cobalt-zinc-cadmium efflux system protein
VHDHTNNTDNVRAISHSNGPSDFDKAFVWGIALNTGFVVVEAVYGWLAHSMALIADAGHNLGDVLGLAMAWIAMILAKRLPSQTHTYGLRRGTILAALANAMLLLLAVGAIAVDGVRRLIEPIPVATVTVMGVAMIGIVMVASADS